MLVRQSPNAKISQDKVAANWPPKSPYEALLSSPSGRKKWSDRQDRAPERSPSPSPMRRPMSSSKALQVAMQSGEDEEGEEDEETLQLQLQAIEARLKLKKLKQAKAKRGLDSDAGSVVEGHGKRIESAGHPPSKRARMEDSVQIPVSPVKERVALQQSTSPARVLLGIDKGLKAQHVSLKRPNTGAATAARPNAMQSTPAPKAKSFSERIAESRLTDQDRNAKEERIEQARSRGFGLPPSSSTASFAEATTPRKDGPSSVTRSQPALSQPANRPSTSSTFRRPAGPPRTDSASSRSSMATSKGEGRTASQKGSTSAPSRSEAGRNPSDDTSEGSFDSFSSLHLSRRHLEHPKLSGLLVDKELYTLPRMLKEVKAPHYDPPDCENDFVVFGVLASKSNPYDSKPRHHTNSTHSDGEDANPALGPKNKFMVLKLCDLEWEVDVFLFDTAFARFWKLTPGTVLAILNPAILPPKTHRDNGRFSLKLTSSEDTILEIGTARDLGFCKSVKKDGQPCNAWVNKRKTEFCDYHVNLQLEKTRANRMEVNGMFRFNTTTSSSTNNNPRHHSKKLAHGESTRRQDPRKRDQETGEFYYAVPGGGHTAAQIMDAEEQGGRAEALQRRLAAKERERELARKLGALGNGAGAEYLRANGSTTLTADGKRRPVRGGGEEQRAATAAALGHERDDAAPPEKPDAEALGLVGVKANVRLSPVKRKRAFGASASSATISAHAMGWGGANKRGLIEPAAARKGGLSPERGQTTLGLQAESSPRKRARFALEQGIREPGRESLGDVRTHEAHDYDDDDDGLDIV